MFKENKRHRQKQLFGLEFLFDKKKYNKLENSKEYAFYKLIFSNIAERTFAPLYSDKKSRPNAPINVMVSALVLKVKRGWSYKQLLERIDFDIKTRIALGLFDLNETPFTEPTIIGFQNRINDYIVKHGVNLFSLVFDKLTREQLKELNVKADIQRSDSFLVSSNIRKYSRLQLLIEVLLRFIRILEDADLSEIEEIVSPYLEKKTSGKYIYALSGKKLSNEIEKIGKIYLQIIKQFTTKYKDEEAFRILLKVFHEHFYTEEAKVSVIPSDSLPSDTVQSPDDLDATYRKKGGKESRGYSVNVTETSNPKNQINLITDVVVEPNNKDDSRILKDRIDCIKLKTPQLNELHTDAAFGSKDNYEKLRTRGITHIQTAIRGRKCKVPFEIDKIKKDTDEENNNYHVSCPNQSVRSEKTRKHNKALFAEEICTNCDHKSDCPAKSLEKCNKRVYYFSKENYLRKKRLRSILKLPKGRRKLRANIEGTVNEYRNCSHKHTGKLKVRGRFKTSIWTYMSTIGINFGRIYRYQKNGGDDPSFIEKLKRNMIHIFNFRKIIMNEIKYWKKFLYLWKINKKWKYLKI